MVFEPKPCFHLWDQQSIQSPFLQKVIVSLNLNQRSLFLRGLGYKHFSSYLTTYSGSSPGWMHARRGGCFQLPSSQSRVDGLPRVRDVCTMEAWSPSLYLCGSVHKGQTRNHRMLTLSLPKPQPLEMFAIVTAHRYTALTFF